MFGASKKKSPTHPLKHQGMNNYPGEEFWIKECVRLFGDIFNVRDFYSKTNRRRLNDNDAIRMVMSGNTVTETKNDTLKYINQIYSPC